MQARALYLSIAGALTALGACGPPSSTPDARPVDAMVDSMPPDAGRCGANVFFTGELIDWGSTDAVFRGVFDARWTLRGQPSVSAMTAPNGRIELCVPNQSGTFDIDAPGTHIDAIAMLNIELVRRSRPAFFSARVFASLTAANQFYQANGLTAFDETRGHVLVYAATDAASGLALDHAHGTAIGTSDGSSWGDSGGRWRLFPNVVIDDAMATMTGPGPGFPIASIPLAAGKLTFLHYDFVLE